VPSAAHAARAVRSINTIPSLAAVVIAGTLKRSVVTMIGISAWCSARAGTGKLLHIRTANGVVGSKALALHDDAMACRTDRDDVGAEVTVPPQTSTLVKPVRRINAASQCSNLCAGHPGGRRDAACQFRRSAPTGVTPGLVPPHDDPPHGKQNKQHDDGCGGVASRALDK
jgi:hypothetical protein